MDEGDEYVPQISQMDYQNLMDVSSGGGYYDQMQAQPYATNPVNETYQQQQRMQAAMSMQQQQQQSQMMSPHMQMANPGGYMPPGMAQQQMHASRMAPQQPAPSQPTKPKSTRKSKKAAAAAAAASAEVHPPAQQSLPASYQMMPSASQQPNANPMMQAQQQQQQRMNPNPYAYMQQQQQQQQARWPAGEQGYGASMSGQQQQPQSSYARTAQPQQAQPPGSSFAAPPQQYPGMATNAAAQAQQNPYYQPGISQMKPGYYGQPPGYPMPYASNPQVQSAQQARPAHPQSSQPQYAGQPQQQQQQPGPYFSDPNNPGGPSYYPQAYPPSQGYAPPPQTGQPTKMNNPQQQQQQPIQSQHSLIQARPRHLIPRRACLSRHTTQLNPQLKAK